MNSSRNIAWTVAVVLVIFNLAQLYQNYYLKKKIYFVDEKMYEQSNANKLAHRLFPENTVLLPIKGKLLPNLNEQLKRNKRNIIILFDPTGCGSCLNEKYLWNDLGKSTKTKVFAVTNHPYRSELLDYLKNSDISIDIYQDSTGILNKWFKPYALPVKLVCENNKIIFADYVRDDVESREQFSTFVQMIEKDN